MCHNKSQAAEINAVAQRLSKPRNLKHYQGAKQLVSPQGGGLEPMAYLRCTLWMITVAVLLLTALAEIGVVARPDQLDGAVLLLIISGELSAGN